MKKFIKNCLFFLMLLLMVFSLGLLLPNNSPERSIDYSLLQKHKLLNDTKGKRIILTGGSNVIFGFNSQIIADSLNIPVINHAIHAGYGMKYILDDLEAFVKKGDVIFFSPEYSHFLDKSYLGKEPLLFSLTAVPKNLKLISGSQFINVLPYIPQFSFQKIKSFVYHILKKTKIVIKTRNTYGEFAINKNGDNNTHWLKRKQNFTPYLFTKKYNSNAFNYLLNYKKKIEEKGATLVVIYPSLCSTSFTMNYPVIKEIEQKLKQHNIPVIKKPTDFSYNDEFFFDSPYHLNGRGVLKRTNQIIELIKKNIQN